MLIVYLCVYLYIYLYFVMLFSICKQLFVIGRKTCYCLCPIKKELDQIAPKKEQSDMGIRYLFRYSARPNIKGHKGLRSCHHISIKICRNSTMSIKSLKHHRQIRAVEVTTFLNRYFFLFTLEKTTSCYAPRQLCIIKID